ncbi:hypothetical protein [Streptomyces youssoufiensis]
MSETLIPPASPLAHLIAIARTTKTRDDLEREAAITAARTHVDVAYPRTLAKTLAASHWSGYPALPAAGLAPSATASLHGGGWVHHTRDQLTVVAPCACGEGYVAITLTGERHLLRVLSNLEAGEGRFRHETGWPACDSRLPRGTRTARA